MQIEKHIDERRKAAESGYTGGSGRLPLSTIKTSNETCEAQTATVGTGL